MLGLGFVVSTLIASRQPQRPVAAVGTVDSIVSSRSATYVRGDTLQIEGRGERKSSPRKTYLILPDTVYQLVGTQRLAVPAKAAEAIRVTAENIRDFSRRGSFPSIPPQTD